MTTILALKILTSTCNEQSDPEWLNVCFPMAHFTSSGMLLAKARPLACGEIHLFPYSLDIYLLYQPRIWFSNMNWCNIIATRWNIYLWLLLFCFPLPSYEHPQCPTSNDDRILALLSYPLKTGQIILCWLIKDTLASILHTATTSSVQLVMAKVRIPPTQPWY